VVASAVVGEEEEDEEAAGRVRSLGRRGKEK